MKENTIVKFGGSSINNAEKIEIACSTISTFVNRGENVVAVISAVRNVTNVLKQTADCITVNNVKECISNCSEQLLQHHRHSPLTAQDLHDLERLFKLYVQSGKKLWIEDALLVKGEEFSARNFAQTLNDRGIATVFLNFDNPDFPTVVHGFFGNARVDLETTKTQCESMTPYFKEHRCICIPGFGGVDRDSGRVKTLRRGGSDAVAIALCYGFSAHAFWMMTDVHGIKRAYTPHLTNAPTIPVISVDELRDAGIYGAKVPNEIAIRPLMLYCPPTTFIVKYDGVELASTQIVLNRDTDASHPVELAAQREVIIYAFEGLHLHATISALESQLDQKMIDFLSLGGGDYTRKLAIPSDQESYVDAIVSSYTGRLDMYKSHNSLVGIVGKGMAKVPGIIAKMGNALAKGKINIYYQFDVSPISCGVIVDKHQAESAVELLFEAFNLGTF
ncbi:MAG: aspartate kinase [Candidatus Bathyarchaeota archaeon]|nr:MAG: aspartate kinase [Candidatus Bathyarchaeota archaeon]